MVFDIEGKVALITGGASGIGLEFAKKLLKNGIKGVTLADISETSGKQVAKELEAEFGPGKVIFVLTDVTNDASFERAFQETVKTFGNIDILHNNAGIGKESTWKKLIDINMKAVVTGTLLGMENYLQKYRSGPESVIINTGSITGYQGTAAMPIYTGTKWAVHGMTKSWGDPVHYERTKVRVIAISPGVTTTSLVANLSPANHNELLEGYNQFLDGLLTLPIQTVEPVAAGLLEILKNAENGSCWVVEGGNPPYQYIWPARESFAPK